MENPKIKDEELKQIIDDQNELQKMLSQVGVLEAQKNNYLMLYYLKATKLKNSKLN